MAFLNNTIVGKVVKLYPQYCILNYYTVLQKLYKVYKCLAVKKWKQGHGCLVPRGQVAVGHLVLGRM